MDNFFGSKISYGNLLQILKFFSEAKINVKQKRQMPETDVN